LFKTRSFHKAGNISSFSIFDTQTMNHSAINWYIDQHSKTTYQNYELVIVTENTISRTHLRQTCKNRYTDKPYGSPRYVFYTKIGERSHKILFKAQFTSGIQPREQTSDWLPPTLTNSPFKQSCNTHQMVSDQQQDMILLLKS
jgi:hypothetical protein